MYDVLIAVDDDEDRAAAQARAVADLPGATEDVTAHLCHVFTDVEIVAAADAVDADAICVSGRKRSPTGKAVFGSVTQDVILSSDLPVFAVPIPGDT